MFSLFLTTNEIKKLHSFSLEGCINYSELLVSSINRSLITAKYKPLSIINPSILKPLLRIIIHQTHLLSPSSISTRSRPFLNSNVVTVSQRAPKTKPARRRQCAARTAQNKCGRLINRGARKRKRGDDRMREGTTRWA